MRIDPVTGKEYTLPEADHWHTEEGNCEDFYIGTDVFDALNDVEFRLSSLVDGLVDTRDGYGSAADEAYDNVRPNEFASLPTDVDGLRDLVDALFQYRDAWTTHTTLERWGNVLDNVKNLTRQAMLPEDSEERAPLYRGEGGNDNLAKSAAWMVERINNDTTISVYPCDDPEHREPEPEDYVIHSDGTVGTPMGGAIGTFAEWDDQVRAIREDMEANSFFPDVWTLSDHGNLSLVTADVMAAEIVTADNDDDETRGDQ